MAVKDYKVIYEHDGSMWFARIASLDGCHTQGRTIAQARERIRDALSLFDEQADRAVLVDDVRLPKTLAAELRSALAEKRRVDAAVARVQATVRRLARSLTRDVGVSLADTGELLGVSKQRVQQMLDRS
ncbi:MAG: type II toxin-antitoxin system HicB family antitoxin [Polyangiaceae bacterium]|jgi:predicted RNase H-like HicB family nuclease